MVEELDAIDAFYGRCHDASMFNCDGVKITFHRDAALLDETARALRVRAV
ncbi:MAG: hypothetical protein ACQESR_09455 [Planctomycetota bacterium]